MTIIQYRNNIPDWASHQTKNNTIKEVWVKAWEGRFAVLRDSEAVSLRHERVDKDIPFILNQRDWKPIKDIEGYEEVNNLL